MNRLYWITGGASAEVQKKVYQALLRWSAIQQFHPLQPWPGLPGDEADKPDKAEKCPDFYLHPYLGWGDRQTLAALTERCGPGGVEEIYLRGPQEQDWDLLAAGIYYSYDPEPGIAACLADIVKTVFSDYNPLPPALAAEMGSREPQLQPQAQAAQTAQAQAWEGRAPAQTAQPAEPTEPAQSAEQKTPETPEKPERPEQTPAQKRNRRIWVAVGLVLWLIFVSLLTAGIWNGTRTHAPATETGTVIFVTPYA